MELLFYFLCGILFAESVLIALLFLICLIYGVLKFAFGIFDELQNPRISK